MIGLILVCTQCRNVVHVHINSFLFDVCNIMLFCYVLFCYADCFLYVLLFSDTTKIPFWFMSIFRVPLRVCE
jgi:hypothetical protein